MHPASTPVDSMARERRQEINELLANGDPDGALDLAEAMAEEFPDNPGVLGQLCRVYIALADWTRAKLCLQVACDAGLPEKRAQRMGLKIAFALKDHDMLMRYADGIDLSRAGISVAQLFTLADAYQANRRWEDLKRCLSCAMLRYGDNPKTLRRLFIAHVESDPALGSEAAMLALAESWIFDTLDGRAYVRLLPILKNELRDSGPELAALAERVKAAWPNDEKVQADANKALKPLRAVGWRNAALTGVGRSETASDQLEQLREFVESKSSEAGSAMKDFVWNLTPDALTRPIVGNDPENEVIVSSEGPSNQVFVVFTGLQDKATLHVPLFDAFASVAGASAIYLRDFNRLAYCNGIRALGDDFEQSVTALSGLIRRFGKDTHVTFVSSSAGGIGALNYGARLGADRILCFSPPAAATIDFFEEVGDTRGRLVLRRIKKLVQDQSLTDPISKLVARESLPAIDIVYGEDSAFDRIHAEALHAALPVALYPLKGFGQHASLLRVLELGQLQAVLSGDMSGLSAQMETEFES